MSRPPHQLCLDRTHCPLAKTRAFIRTDDPAKPHVCPLAKPECVRELCDIPKAQGSLGPWVSAVLVLLVSAAALAWRQSWLPKEWTAQLHQEVTAAPAATPPIQPAAEVVALQKQKQEAEAAVAALQKEREKDLAARLKAEQEAASARAEVAKIKQDAPALAPKAAPPAGTISDDLAKFFPGTQPKP